MIGDIITANTYTLNCGGAAGNMIRIVDEDTDVWGHGISEVIVFKGAGRCLVCGLCSIAFEIRTSMGDWELILSLSQNDCHLLFIDKSKGFMEKPRLVW